MGKLLQVSGGRVYATTKLALTFIATDKMRVSVRL